MPIAASPTNSNAKQETNPAWETTIDRTVSLVALFLLSPLVLAISAFIKAVSPGPVIFKQQRIGKNGSPFTIYKFRTMHVNASTVAHESHTTALIRSNKPMTKLDAKGDKRIIPLGRLIRASGLDELPQLINVIKRDMSVVGPRPCLESEYAEYTDAEKQRLDTLPGLTGLWQVSGKNRLTFEQMIECDVRYAHKKSLSLYLLIILKTPVVLIQQVLETRKAKALSPSSKFLPRPNTAPCFEREVEGE